MGVVCAVGTPLGKVLSDPYPIVTEDLSFEFDRYVPIVVKGRPLFDHVPVRRDLDKLPPFVHAYELYRYQGRSGAQKTHLYPDVLRLVVLIYEQVVDLPYLF